MTHGDLQSEESSGDAFRASIAKAALVALAVVGLAAVVALVRKNDERASPVPTVELLDPEPSNPTSSVARGPTTTVTTVGLGNSVDTGDRCATKLEPRGEADSVLPEGGPMVAELAKFVENATGRRFLAPVRVEQESDRRFQRLLLEQLAEDESDLKVAGRLLRALRLVPRDVDVVREMRKLLGFGVVGFYDPESKKLVVRGLQDTPFVRSTIVHELVHALDDQWFDLDRPELEKRKDEAGFGLSAVGEGHARLVENRWKSTLSASEAARLQLEELSLPVPPDAFTIPPILIQLVLSPYELGEKFVGAVLREPDCGLEDLFAALPDTSAEVIEPEQWLSGFEPLDLKAPPADGTIFDDGMFGQLMLELLLDVVTSRSEELASNWLGDAYAAWSEQGRDCLRVDLAVGEAQREVVAALDEWATDEHGSAEVELMPGGRVRLTACS